MRSEFAQAVTPTYVQSAHFFHVFLGKIEVPNLVVSDNPVNENMVTVTKYDHSCTKYPERQHETADSANRDFYLSVKALHFNVYFPKIDAFYLLKIFCE